MAQPVNVNFKLDADVKKRMEWVGRECRIPFEVSADPFYSESNVRVLKGRLDDIKSGKAKFEEHELIEVE